MDAETQKILMDKIDQLRTDAIEGRITGLSFVTINKGSVSTETVIKGITNAQLILAGLSIAHHSLSTNLLVASTPT